MAYSHQMLQIALFALLCYLAHCDERVMGRYRDSYPDPMVDFAACNHHTYSFVCDPDRLITAFEVEQLNTQIALVVNDTTCPCSHYSCSRNPGGYKIGIALTKRLLPDEPMAGDDDLNEQEYKAKRQSWILGEAKKFTHHLLEHWKMGHCDETVIVFYSLYDSVLYAAAGDVARVKLNHSRIHSVLTGARAQFEPNGNLFKGLLKIVKDFRSVFFGTYQPGKPVMGESRRNGAFSFHKENSRGVTVKLAGLSLIAMATSLLASAK